MKKQIITLVLLLIGTTNLWAQNKPMRIMVSGSCDVNIRQSDTLFVVTDDGIIINEPTLGKMIHLGGSDDYFVTLPELESLQVYGASDATNQGTLKGQNLEIIMAGSPDATLTVDYDSINVSLTGCAELTLKGHCRSLVVNAAGSSEIITNELVVDNKSISTTGSGSWNNAKGGRDVKILYRDTDWKHGNSLLYDAEWNGFEAGLNILTPGFNHWSEELPKSMELRQMRSWCFNINIADVGIALNKHHSIGIYTGIGIGWNNYCFNNPVYFWKGEDGTLQESAIVDELGEKLNVNRSKIGVFYAQMPLMIEFKPFHKNMYIDLGVTGAMRLTSWQTIRFGDNPMSYAVLSEDNNDLTMPADNTKYLEHRDLCVNFFKLDATLRVGSTNNNIGLFAKYALLPVFTEGKGYDVHPFSIGLSINF